MECFLSHSLITISLFDVLALRKLFKSCYLQTIHDITVTVKNKSIMSQAINI